MSDLIERQAAIDKLDPLFESLAIDKIKALPSAQPERKAGRWIPCSVRLPKEEGEYLVSFDDGFIATTGYYDNDFELWADAGEPLAWMPLPEPYKEGTE